MKKDTRKAENKSLSTSEFFLIEIVSINSFKKQTYPPNRNNNGQKKECLKYKKNRTLISKNTIFVKYILIYLLKNPLERECYPGNV